MKGAKERQHSAERKFFNLTTDSISLEIKYIKSNIGVLVIAHLLVDAIPFLESLNSLFYVDTVFAKPKSINQKVFEDLSKKYNIVIADRDNIDDISYVSRFIKPERDGFIIIDIGGYFSKVSKKLKDTYGKAFLGCIEDTENGLLKYVSQKIDCPFYQVARSPLKINEDYLVGQAISFSAESIFRNEGVLFNGQRIGIIGFGKIGSGVANAFRSRQAIVLVNDIDPIKITHAYSQGFIPQEKNSLLRSADIICLATGHKSLSYDDFSNVKSGSYVFTVTSSDDEIDVSWLKDKYTSEPISPYITQYKRGKHYFYLLNKGNAINFIHGTTVSSFILLVQAEIVACALFLATGKSADDSYSLPHTTRQIIADFWLKIFTSKYIQHE